MLCVMTQKIWFTVTRSQHDFHRFILPIGHSRDTDAIQPAFLLHLEAQMSDAVTRAAAVLKEHRESIDRLDAILIYTLGERFKHTQAVGKLKAEHDLPPSDPAREATQIARLEDLANRADVDPEFAKKFLNFIIAEVIQHHKSHQSTS